MSTLIWRWQDFESTPYCHPCLKDVKAAHTFHLLSTLPSLIHTFAGSSVASFPVYSTDLLLLGIRQKLCIHLFNTFDSCQAPSLSSLLAGTTEKGNWTLPQNDIGWSWQEISCSGLKTQDWEKDILNLVLINQRKQFSLHSRSKKLKERILVFVSKHKTDRKIFSF